MPAVLCRWHWMDRGRQAGPVTWDELQALAKSGRLRPNDMVLREGGRCWQPARLARDMDVSDPTGTPSAPDPALLRPPPPVPKPLENANQSALPPTGLKPGRMVFGAVLLIGGIFGTVANYDAAVAQGGGKYIIFTGPIIWGAILLLTSVGGKPSCDAAAD